MMMMIMKLETAGFYESVAPILEEFHRSHNLMLEKFWRGSSSWRFSFKHPTGSIACLEMVGDSPDQVEINSYCWKDDYDSGTRRLRVEVTKDVEVDHLYLTLEKCFQDLMTWEINSLNQVVGGFQEIWSKNHSREEYLAFEGRYPTPIT